MKLKDSYRVLEEAHNAYENAKKAEEKGDAFNALRFYKEARHKYREAGYEWKSGEMHDKVKELIEIINSYHFKDYWNTKQHGDIFRKNIKI